MNPILATAQHMHAHGINVVPVVADGSKRPALSGWQRHTTTADDLDKWFGGQTPAYTAIGAVCGPLSGNLEMLEIEGDFTDRLGDLEVTAAGTGRLDLLHRLNGWCEASPSGGVHWLYRVAGDTPVPGNTKLASTADRKVIAETRGTGGQTVLAPSGGTAHKSGKPWSVVSGGPEQIPTFTLDERAQLHDLFRTLDETPTPAPTVAPHRPVQADLAGIDQARPGDLFAARTTWDQILTPHGWQIHHQTGDTTYWTRPGKSLSEGASATTAETGDRTGLYVFSTSTDFDPETPYSKFGAYALLEHGGDHGAAARALAAQGYATRPTTAPAAQSPMPAPSAQRIEADEDTPASWAPVDLAAHIEGRITPARPRHMVRDDGVALLYPGLVHSIAGESESGKSMLSLAVAAQILTKGGRVAYVDFESDPQTIVGRARKLGATDEQILHGLHYMQPETDPDCGLRDEAQAFKALLNTAYDLVILDGVTEALSVSRVSSIENDEVTQWIRRIPRAIARATGAAVVLVDHVTKNSDSRGRFAIGAQAKLSALDGAAYIVEPLAPLGVGMCGRLSIRVAKDRPGRVRPHGGTWRKSDRTQTIAVALIDSTDTTRIDYRLEAPAPTVTPEQAQQDREDQLAQTVLHWCRERPTPPSYNQIVKAVPGSREAVRVALDELIEKGRIRAVPGPRGSVLHEVTE